MDSRMIICRALKMIIMIIIIIIIELSCGRWTLPHSLDILCYFSVYGTSVSKMVGSLGPDGSRRVFATRDLQKYDD